MIKDRNYIVIQGFMVSELKLKGNDLLVYAIIYGFSQDGENEFSGSLQYLADWCNSTKQGILGNLKSLIDKDLIIKKEEIKNNIKFCRYSTKFNGIKDSLMGIKQSLTGIKESLTNNIEYNINNNNINIYGEFKNVKLSKEEYEKLKEKNLLEYIDKLSSYMASKGKRYKSHYATILNWARKEPKEKVPEWFNKEIKKEEATEKEQEDLEKMLEDFR